MSLIQRSRLRLAMMLAKECKKREGAEPSTREYGTYLTLYELYEWADPDQPATAPPWVIFFTFIGALIGGVILVAWLILDPPTAF